MFSDVRIGTKLHLPHACKILLYADDLVLVAETRRELQHMLEVLDEACTWWGMSVNVSKTKIVQVRTGEHQPTSEQPITLQGQTLEEVQSFPYLGSEVDQSGKVQKKIAVMLKGWLGVSDVEKKAIRE